MIFLSNFLPVTKKSSNGVDSLQLSKHYFPPRTCLVLFGVQPTEGTRGEDPTQQSAVIEPEPWGGALLPEQLVN